MHRRPRSKLHHAQYFVACFFAIVQPEIFRYHAQFDAIGMFAIGGDVILFVATQSFNSLAIA